MILRDEFLTGDVAEECTDCELPERSMADEKKRAVRARF